MSHFSQVALPYNMSNFSQVAPPSQQAKVPTTVSIAMANAFVQICKYHRGRHASLLYNPASSLYYTLFVDNEGDTIDNITQFIHNNRHIIIHYLEQHYCEEYKSKSYYKETKIKWEHCSVDDIIFALSTNHDQCLQVLDYNGDGFIWITHMDDYSSGEPCHTHESSDPETLKKKIKAPIKSTQNDWHYYADGVIGGADY